MKLKEYLEQITKLVEQNPDALEYEVVHCVNQSGDCEEVWWDISEGVLEDNQFRDKRLYEEYYECEFDDDIPSFSEAKNSITIN